MTNQQEKKTARWSGSIVLLLVVLACPAFGDVDEGQERSWSISQVLALVGGAILIYTTTQTKRAVDKADGKMEQEVIGHTKKLGEHAERLQDHSDVHKDLRVELGEFKEFHGRCNEWQISTERRIGVVEESSREIKGDLVRILVAVGGKGD